MELKKKIKPNEELYGDYELIPLNLDAVQQRIDFFDGMVEKYIIGDNMKFYKYHKAWVFWKEIKENHCERY